MSERFAEPQLRLSTVDTYLVRRSIRAVVHQAATLFSGTVLDVGCGHMPYRDLLLSRRGVERYLGLDLETNEIYDNRPDLTWDGRTIPLPDASVDGALSTELFEHCPEPRQVMSEIWRVLRPGGVLVFTVPFLWPLHDVPYDQHRFTPFSLSRQLKEAGFQDVRLGTLGGWDASLAQVVGLYARRRPMPSLVRCVLSLLAFVFVSLCSPRAGKVDLRQLKEEREFRESDMFTGLYGVACKPGIPTTQPGGK